MRTNSHSAERWIEHYARLLQGCLSATQRERAEAELAYWKRQAQRQAA